MLRTLLLLVALLLIIGIVLVVTGVVNLYRDGNGDRLGDHRESSASARRGPTSPCRWCGTETRQVDVPSVTVGNARPTPNSPAFAPAAPAG